jgi:phosphatidylglycerol---prolipoprotein diacylglyceryl transferase
MNFHLFLFSYIVWDPSREMFKFNLPFLNRPILWYGFFFAFGFFLGYLCLTYLLRRYFLFLTQIRKEDVISWPDLIKAIATQAQPIAKAIFVKLGNPYKKWCQDWTLGKEIPKEKKDEILKAINQVIADSELTFKMALPSSFKRLLRYVAKRSSKIVFESVQKKLQLQQELPGMVISLKQQTTKIAEQMTFYVIIGAVVGSRLGDVLFYQNWSDIARDPFSIVAVWQGGLASHGGAIGILIALGIFAKNRKMVFWRTVDFAVIPTAIAAVCIRIGNFFNQEILGIPTTLPWGILFLHPADGGPIVPRHPAQLYEAIAYLCVFAILLFYWHRGLPFQKSGKLTGLFLVLVFSLRFLIEWVKVEQSVHISGGSFLTMGQWLSIPFILLGFWLLFGKRSG